MIVSTLFTISATLLLKLETKDKQNKFINLWKIIGSKGMDVIQCVKKRVAGSKGVQYSFK
jgi:hypothetical protein